jgi:O-antigen/teichoic acid export membrane protein
MSNQTDTSKGRKLAGNSIALMLSKVTASLSVILLFVILSRHFAPTEYGTFRQLWLINKGLALEVFSLGLPLSLFYFLPQLKSEEQKSFILVTILILSFLGCVLAGLIILFSPWIATLFNNPELAYLLKLFCLFPLFSLPTLAIDGTLISIDKVFSLSIFTICDRLLLFVFSILALITWHTLHAFCLTLVVYAFVRFAISISVIFFYYKNHSFKRSGISLASQLKVGLPSGLSNILGLINVEIDKIIISSFFTAKRFAVYANGAFDIPFLGTVSASISSVLMPEYVRLKQMGDINGLISLWHNSIHKIALLFIPLMVFFFIVARDFITFMFSDIYAESAVVFQIYLVGIIANMTWYGTILVSIGHSREPFYASAIGLCINVILNYLFILKIGFLGPVIASVITNYIVATYYLYKIKKHFNISWIDVYPWRTVFHILMIAIASAILITPLMFYDLIHIKVIRIMFHGLIYFLSTFSILFLFKLISHDDILFVKSFIDRSTRKVFRFNRKE